MKKFSDRLVLRWNGTGFNPVSSKGEGVHLELDDSQSLWVFSYTDGTSLVTRRTALRRANEIAKVGFVNPASGARVGINWKCVEEKDTYAGLPDVLTSAEHDYNKKLKS